MHLSDDDLCLIALCATEEVGPATVASLRQAAGERGCPLRDLIVGGRAALAGLRLTGAALEALGALRSPLLAGRAVVEQLERLGARPVLAGTEDYPDRLAQTLGRAAPPVLFVGGNVTLLHGATVAIVGSRRPSAEAESAARALAAALAGAGSTIVSGGAQGIDTAGHAGALSTGATAMVPPEGIARLHRNGAPAAEVLAERWCLVGQFPPRAAWRTEYALMRNRTIVALSDAVVAFEPRDTGGTWYTANEALKAHRPLFVVSATLTGARGRGLRRLVNAGAVALDPARMPDAADFARLAADYRPPPRPHQRPLPGM